MKAFARLGPTPGSLATGVDMRIACLDALAFDFEEDAVMGILYGRRGSVGIAKMFCKIISKYKYS